MQTLSPEQLELDQFTPCLQHTFRVRVEGTADIELVLCEATARPCPGGDAPGRSTGPKPLVFSLIFRGPPSPALTQGTFVLHHPALGQFPLFLVPIGPGPGGPHYEALFNRSRSSTA